jgi:PAS domain S-box-containing protein
LLCAILTAIGGVFLFSLGSIENLDSAERNSLHQIGILHRVAKNVGLQQAEVFRHVAATDPEEKRHDQIMARLVEMNARGLTEYQETINSEAERRLYADVLQAGKVYSDQTEKLLALNRALRSAEAATFALTTQIPAYRRYQMMLDALIGAEEVKGREGAAANTVRIDQIRVVGDILIGLAILIALATGGAVIRVVGMLRQDKKKLETEVDERKRAEEVLRESERRFREMLENVELIAVTLDKDGMITFCNDYLLRLTGWKREELIGADWFSKFIPDANVALKKMFLETIEAGEVPTHYENSIKTRASELREIVWNNTMLRDTAGNIVGTASLAEDVTERKRSEVAALAGEAQIREQAKLLDLAHDAILVRDMDDRVEYWNHGAEELYGWNAAEVQGRQAFTFLHAAPPAAALAARVDVIENGKWSGECKHLCKDGGIVTVRSRWSLLQDELGKPKSILIINTDITDQKRVEDQFLRAQRLESIGTLASGVAHDLNNALVPILMVTPLLRGNPPKEEREKFLAIVESSAERGASIVNQVLTFARGADGDRILLQPVCLIEEIAKIAQQTFPKTISVRTHYTENLRLLEADATQLHQVLLNLAINARDAMPHGGDLSLSVVDFEVDDNYASMTPGAKSGPHVLLEVSDTGTGIPSETIEKIFDPFFTTKELGEGTGLGLSTVIGIVKSHHGFIEVDSEVGRGTSFKVFLPANTSELAFAETSEARLPPANGELLLIVDDEKSILEVAGMILEGHGYRVLTAADATEALAIFALRMNEIELVLTDLAMPFMDGVALIRTLQKMKPDVRVIASTGRNGRKGRANEIAHLDVCASLTKPYNRNKLLKTLHDALNPQPENNGSHGAATANSHR